jgi:hypothetical protein
MVLVHAAFPSFPSAAAEGLPGSAALPRFPPVPTPCAPAVGSADSFSGCMRSAARVHGSVSRSSYWNRPNSPGSATPWNGRSSQRNSVQGGSDGQGVVCFRAVVPECGHGHERRVERAHHRLRGDRLAGDEEWNIEVCLDSSAHQHQYCERDREARRVGNLRGDHDCSSWPAYCPSNGWQWQRGLSLKCQPGRDRYLWRGEQLRGSHLGG